MADTIQATNADPIAARAQSGEPPAIRYRTTTGPVDTKRPGRLPGSTTGAQGDPGREGTAALGVDLQAIAPHTGF